MHEEVSVVVPAKNEAGTIAEVIKSIQQHFPANYEIIVVNDGSTDRTAEIAANHGAITVNHPYSKGNGAAIKSGALAAQGEILVFMDADGQHDPKDIQTLTKQIELGYDMVVGARTSRSEHASTARWFANTIYNKLSSWLTKRPIKDLTSGFRAVRRSMFIDIIDLLPNGFSYPTTSTMAFLRQGLNVTFVPVTVHQRRDPTTSHIKPLQDGIRFFTIILKISTLYSPLKVFGPTSIAFLAMGLAYYVFTFITQGRFTNMGALFITTSIIVFLIGLVSEQISTLIHLSLAGRERRRNIASRKDNL